MDTGKKFFEKTVSREPIERIQVTQHFMSFKIQREFQQNLKKTGLIHLVAKNDRLTSVMIPSVMLVLAVPMIGYGIYMITTGPAPNS